jgi:hypothetical protein
MAKELRSSVTKSFSDPRITGNWRPVMGISPSASILEFVHGLIRRYEYLQRPWPMTVLILRHVGIANTILNSYHFTIVPRLFFTWHSGSRVSSTGLLPHLGLLPAKMILTQPIQPTELHAAERLMLGGIVSRLVIRSPGSEILERTQYGRKRKDIDLETWEDRLTRRVVSAVLPVQKILRLSGTLEPQEAIDHATGRGPAGFKEKGQKPPPRPQGSPESSFDINRLTERVIQAIDRRIMAHRERLGRP